ncbi:MAG: hypothetical protein A2511_09225 [Deltaproteobacteria bacterium RIFOXYD12_FULL_50_9]|nr:MAG: hypothetical protein A2511_09225 [Deltaproteobacteria bacterium RIFOXYD12_FULL_50_9]
MFRYGLNNSFEIGLDIPYVSHTTATFDGFIDNWHHFFNLPEGQRPNRANKLLEYRYRVNGLDRFLLNNSTSGLGDIMFSAGYQLPTGSSPDRAAALRTYLKLPTGDAEKLSGSGAADLGISIFGQESSNALNIFGGGGLLLTGKGRVLADRRQPLVGFASLGAGWAIWEWLDLKIQFDGHTPFYESDLDELGKGSIQLNMGGALHFYKNWTLTINVAEDIMVNTAPDVVFYLELQTTF